MPQKKIRVHELAKELGMTNQETLDLALALGIRVRTHSSSIEDPQADRVRRRADADGLRRDAQPEEPAPVKKAPAAKAAARLVVPRQRRGIGIRDLANEIGISPEKCFEIAGHLRIPVENVESMIEDAQADRVRRKAAAEGLGNWGASRATPAPRPAGPRVITSRPASEVTAPREFLPSSTPFRRRTDNPPAAPAPPLPTPNPAPVTPTARRPLGPPPTLPTVDTGPLLVIDGMNIAYEGRAVPSLAQLLSAAASLKSRYPEAAQVIVVDAGFSFAVAAEEKAESEQLLRTGAILMTPSGWPGKADGFVCEVAARAIQQRRRVFVVSNDAYKEQHQKHPWLRDSERMVGGNYVAAIGEWLWEYREIGGPPRRGGRRS
ncbi:MAG: translation initiation factor IF-2 N-terminal domain-containing protein [Acidimicrobiales bacterium]|nr:translation initiation factor IF-2 N-terminal domain-containing protein [Acidimicrobiales bacterium]